MTKNNPHDLLRGLIGEDDYHHMKGVLAGFYDIAQKQIATTVSPIKKSFSVTCGVQTELPGDLYRLIKSDCSFQRTDDRHIIVQGEGSAQLLYYAYPSDINELCAGDTEFEVATEAQSAIPYFAAAYAVLSDSDMRRYYAFMDMYNTILTNIAAGNDAQAVITVVKTEDM